MSPGLNGAQLMAIWDVFAPQGLEDSAKGFNPISASLIKASTERTYFVPEGQHDRSQARSAWSVRKIAPSQRDD
jgi:hypothetical protein